VARLEGRATDAAHLYEEAIAAARLAGCSRDRALANELSARFWIARRQDRVALAYLTEARTAWASWGAVAKVRDLERRHAELFAAAPGVVGVGSEAEALDLETVMKAARAISREIEPQRLLRSLVRIAMESAGAERGLLLREEQGHLLVAAEGRIDEEGVVLPDIPLAERSDLPWTMLQWVQQTGEPVVAADAGDDGRWLADPYVRERAPRSILVLPIVQQGKRMGLLYLENNLATRAFGGRRSEIVQVLASQAGVALENARLYEELRQHKERLQAENTYLQEEIRTEHHFEEIVGRSPPLLDALAAVERVALTDSTVLLLGETGVGKELFARAIHDRSPRRGRTLVKVNCGAISAGLFESELFGHVKGAFTGALQRRVGRFELADGGTLFLDEVGELPLETQVKLLRVLQEREFEPLGSSRTMRVDVRVIAATNRDLSRAVREGRFRADLLYRLNVFPLPVPSLAQRRADIPLLVAFFCQTIGKRLGKHLEGFGTRDMDRLMGYGWPGNVRELENVVERAAILAQGPGLRLHPDALGPELPRSAALASPPESGGREGQTLEEIERGHIRRVLLETSGVVEGPRGAARILGINPNTLRSRMKKLGIAARPTPSGNRFRGEA
jgi:formate hydrogenlyase transcriptional activator